ncbi:non-ribosomal peptide synthetase [Microtetraspora malaysiensis]|uniref:non-ribosomal peptide synthetase n=1 Tax=Microtetraspora malaysiensis TaxID=161358 RepID=UPI00082ADB61|nr:non-ribosomal peptide synthetase [Microtetraspora malaysiensis]
MSTTKPASGRAAPNRVLGPADLREAVAGMLGIGAADLDDQQDLLALGLESIALMRVANLLRRAGVRATFEDLVEEPTLARWLALLADARPRPAPAAPPPRRAPVDDSGEHALAPMQQAYWIGSQDGQPLGGVSAHFYAEFDGADIEPERLEAAVHALLARHGMLRARFTPNGAQQVLPVSPWPGLAVHDLRGGAAQEELAELRTRLSHRRFDTERGDVFDVALSLLDGGRTRLHVSISMLVADAQSYQVLLADLAALYRDPGAGRAPLGYSFAQYLADQRDLEDAEAAAAARDYWRGRLAELPGPPRLPLAEGAGLREHRGVTRYYQRLSAAQVARITACAQAEALTLPVVFCAVYAEVLARWSAEPRFLLNLPTFGRRDLHEDVSLIVGDFTNITLLSVDASQPASFAERARGLQAQLRSDLTHADYSGVEVLRDLAREAPGDWLRAPVVFTSVIGMGELFGPQVRECFGTPVWTSSETPQVWLDQQVIESGDGDLLINWDVADGVFPDGLIDALTGAYEEALTSLTDAGSWHRPLAIPLPSGQAAVRARVNDTGAPRRLGRLHQRFFDRAVRDPDRTALLWGESGELSYGELADRAKRIAAGLHAVGVSPGDTVAVTTAKGPWQIAAVLGVLAAGAAYVPVGIDQPPARRERMYRTAGVEGVVCVGDEIVRLGWPGELPVFDIQQLARYRPVLRNGVRPTEDDLAYVIFTSGSTGEPKGVEITHEAAMNTVAAVNEHFGIGERDRVLALSALDFDLSVYDIFGPLSAGGAVVLVDELDRKEARSWGRLVRRHGVTVWNSVPALLDMLLVGGGLSGPAELPRVVMVSGDWVGVDLPGRVRRLRPDARFAALGGATEAAIWSNLLEVEQARPEWTAVPYGFPLRAQRFRVVDGHGRDRPDWAPGELWIGGSGLARAYRNAPEASAAAFVHDGGERWYRTGDRARYLPGGMVEFLGRSDTQVKIGGHRIELGEIEAALGRLPYVDKAVALVVGSAQRRIAAALVRADGGTDGEVDAAAKRALADELPPYMVPDEILTLAELPLTGTGKVDRRRLAALLERTPAAMPRPEPPAGPTEQALAAIWAEILQVAEVGRRDSFFGLGGDSLQATRMQEAVRTGLGVAVTLRQLFSAPSVAELAAVIDAERETAADYEEGGI